MRRCIGVLAFLSMAIFSSCGKKEAADAVKPAAEAQPATQAASGPHAVVTLKDGSKVPGVIVASSQADMVLDGDDGIERKIPLTQVKSVEYGEAPKVAAVRQPSQQPATAKQAAAPQQQAAPPPATSPQQPAAQEQPPAPPPAQAAEAPAPVAPPPPPVTTRTYELPVSSEVSVRTNEPIDSNTAGEGQTFDAQVTRNAKDAEGAVVIPRGSRARIVIKSASKGGRFRGASDLVLDLQSVVINGKSYAIDTADISQKGKSGIGANKRTAEYTGGGAALGAIIGAIAGGGKGAAIGAGAGAGAGVLTQVLTKGGAIKVPAETVLTFQLDKPLKVTAVE